MNKRPLIVGNWKMYVTSLEEAKKFTATLKRKAVGYKGIDVWLAPPFTLLHAVVGIFKNSSFKVGSQSVSHFTDYKRTGEVSVSMVKNVGATFSIIGHSERRAMGESEDAIRDELVAVLNAGLTAVLCIGESERDQAGAYLSVITKQLRSALDGLPAVKTGRLVIAYEPVWAIGKSANEAMSGHDLREMSIFIKKTLTNYMERSVALKVPILYGGAVDATNARKLLEEGDVSGLLVGRASSDIESFTELLNSVKK